jgi:hypothetical protein
VIVSNSEAALVSAPATLSINTAPVASNMLAATKQNLALSIPTAKFFQYANDAEYDPLAVSSVSPSSTNFGTVQLLSGSVKYTPRQNVLGDDRFTYTVIDWRGATGSAFVLVKVLTASQLSGNMLPLAAIPGGYQVSFAGAPGATYSLQRATNVTGPRNLLAPVTPDGAGTGAYADTTAPAPSAYYRVIYP